MTIDRKTSANCVESDLFFSMSPSPFLRRPADKLGPSVPYVSNRPRHWRSEVLPTPLRIGRGGPLGRSAQVPAGLPGGAGAGAVAGTAGGVAGAGGGAAGATGAGAGIGGGAASATSGATARAKAM